jgi:putative transposase
MKNEKPPVGQGKTKLVGRASRPSQEVSRLAGKNKPVGQASRLSEYSWKRHLPHFQLSGGYYFITFSTYNRKPLLPLQKDCVFNAIRFLDGKKYELFAVVILDDHVHMLINPVEELSKIIHSIKSFTAHEINKISNRRGKVWQDENYDRVIRDDDEFLEKINYIAGNPIKANLVTEIEGQAGRPSYRWLYIKGWINNDS